MVKIGNSRYVIASLCGAILLILAILFMFSVQGTQAATLDVCSTCTYTNIQDAINAAGEDDLIRVSSATYNENLLINKSLTLEGGWDSTFSTRTPRTAIINGSGIDRSIHISGTYLIVTIDGFAITGGNAGLDNGGGIFVDVADGSVIHLNDNYIYQNTARSGGGIYADLPARDALSITNSDIFTNSVTMDGGGLWTNFWMSGTLQLTDTEFRYNTAGLRYGGFYASLNNFGEFQISDNVIQENEAIGGSHGGFFLDVENNSEGQFDRNQIIANETADSCAGGEINLGGNVVSTFNDNLVRGNTAVANSGGLYLYLDNHSKIVGNQIIVEDNTSGISYAGLNLYLYDGSVVTMTHGITATGNTASQHVGGVRIYAAYSLVNIPNMYLYDNHALGGSGGGFHVSMGDAGSQFILPNLTAISNTALSDGGGGYAYFDDGSLLDLTGSIFMNNQSIANGGGLFISNYDEGSSLLLDYSHFLTNTSGLMGGGAYIDLPSEIGNLEASHMEVISNLATVDGGGIYANSGGYGGVININYNNFERNVAGINGGGLFLNNCDYGCIKSVDDNIFSNNLAFSGSGGGFYQSGDFASHGSDATFDRNQIFNNIAQINGGGIYFSSEFVDSGSIGSFQDNTIEGNTADGSGGGFYLSSRFAYDGSLGFFNNNSILNNTSGGHGGGVRMNNLAERGASAQFNNNRIEGNLANDDGGGVYMNDAADSAVAEIIGNTIVDNTIWDGGDGGGLFIQDFGFYGSQVRFTDNVISGNIISGTYGSGGGLHIDGMGDGDIAWFIGNTIADNQAVDDGGGLFWDDDVPYGSVLFFEQNDLLRNTAGEDGGGCFFEYRWREGGQVTFNDNRINENIANKDYGGCFFAGTEEKPVYMQRNEFNNNTAGGDGGGVYFKEIQDGADLLFSDNQVMGNRTGVSDTQLSYGGDGAGVWFDEIEYGSKVDFRDNVILGNTANISYTNGITPTGGSYGGFYAYLNDGSLLTMANNDILNNATDADFAGVYLDLDIGSRVVIEDNQIQDNNAFGISAGVVITGVIDSQYTLRHNRILYNDGLEGYGVWIHNGDAVQPLWGTSENNLIAGNSNGGVYLYDANWRSTNDTIADNGDYGIWMTGTVTSTASLANTILWGHASSYGETLVAPYSDRFSMQVTYSDIEGGWAGIGNINQDPIFIGSGDYHLNAGSPAINNVDPASTPATDNEGIPRPVPIGGLADMGAFEWFNAIVTLTPDAADTVLPGETEIYTLSVHNGGNLQDSFILDAPVNPLGWTITFDPPVVNPMPGNSNLVEVAVTIPANAVGGYLNAITVRATSQSDGSVLDIVELSLTVEDVASVSISPDRSSSVAPGSAVVYVHTLTNSGNFTDTITLSANTSAGWPAMVSPSSVILAPGGSTTVDVTVSVPVNAVGGFVNQTMVTATSSSTTGTTTDTATDTSTVVQVADVDINPDYNSIGVAGTTVTYEHTITNHGNASDTFNVSASSSQGWSTQVTPDVLTLASGASGTVLVQVTVPSDSAGLVDATTVTATSQYNVAATAIAVDTTLSEAWIFMPNICR